MKQYQINKAYKTLLKLTDFKLPVRAARDIYMLARQLEPSYSFELQQERKLAEQHGAQYDKNGMPLFATKDDAKAFQSELSEMINLEVELDFKPISISCDIFGDQLITAAEIASLEGFVDFE